MLGSQAHQKCAVLRHGYRPQCRAEAEDQRQVSPDPEEVSYPYDQDSMKSLGPTDNNHVALRNPSDPIYQAGRIDLRCSARRLAQLLADRAWPCHSRVKVSGRTG